MKPQLVMQDMSGVNNADLGLKVKELEKRAAWKKQRVIVVLPADSLMPSKCALAHWNLVFPPNNGVVRMLALGAEVGEAYSAAVEEILAHPELSKWEFLLSIEADNAPPPDGLIKLLMAMEAHPEYSAISGLYHHKGYSTDCHIWGDIRDPVLNFRPQPPDINGGIVECNGLSMGFTLYRLGMFKDKKIVRPFFRTKAGMDGVGTQDLSFWSNAKKYGYRCAVDCSVRVGHYDVNNDIMF